MSMVYLAVEENAATHTTWQYITIPYHNTAAATLKDLFQTPTTVFNTI